MSCTQTPFFVQLRWYRLSTMSWSILAFWWRASINKRRRRTYVPIAFLHSMVMDAGMRRAIALTEVLNSDLSRVKRPRWMAGGGIILFLVGLMKRSEKRKRNAVAWEADLCCLWKITAWRLSGCGSHFSPLLACKRACCTSRRCFDWTPLPPPLLLRPGLNACEADFSPIDWVTNISFYTKEH